MRFCICISAHYQVLINFATTYLTVSTDRAQHRRVGVAGGACAAKGADEQRAWPASFVPRQNIKAGHSRASTSCEVSFVLIRFAEKINQNVRVAQGMTVFLFN